MNLLLSLIRFGKLSLPTVGLMYAAFAPALSMDFYNHLLFFRSGD